MNQPHDKERIKDEERCDYQSDTPPPYDQFDYDTPVSDVYPDDDWLDTSKACNLDDPECEACQ